MCQYKVYNVSSNTHYFGNSLVAADNATEANQIIDEFKAYDKDNIGDSYGYSYVDEGDVIESVFSTIKGIVHYGIFYHG